MAGPQISDPDVREFKVVFALMLSDRFTEKNQLAGRTSVRIAGQPFATPFVPRQHPGQATFYYVDLPPANYTLEVRSNRDGRIVDANPPQIDEPPYYLSEPAYYFPVDVPLAFPLAHDLWPGFPDLLSADQTKPLDDPTQPLAFRQQRAVALLQPTTAYPFPAGATLVRGTVKAGGVELANARVRRIGDGLEYVTGPDGQYVLFFKNVVGATEVMTLRASHALHPDLDRNVEVRRGMTVAQDFVMAP